MHRLNSRIAAHPARRGNRACGARGSLLFALVVSTADCTTQAADVGTVSATAVPLVPENCAAPAGLPAAATTTWPSAPLPNWERSELAPRTLCTTGPGAWLARTPLGGFSDAAAASDQTVALLHWEGILRVDAAGNPVQAVRLVAHSAGLKGFCPAVTGGWYVLGEDKYYNPGGGTAVLKVAESGDVVWSQPGQEGRYFEDCTPTTDGGVILGGAVRDGEDTSHAFWQYVNANGVASPQVTWLGVGAVNDLTIRADGTLCMGGGYWSYALAGRKVMVSCWQGSTKLWALPVEEPALDDHVSLAAWPDGSLLATIRSLRYGPYTTTVVAIDPAGAATETIVPRMVTSYFGNQGSKLGADYLAAVHPLPCSMVGHVRHTVPAASSAGERSVVWERRSAAGVQPLVRLDPAAPAGQPESAVHVRAVLDRPDGSRWFVGGELCYLPGQPYCGWIYRLPALLACPAGSAVPP